METTTWPFQPGLPPKDLGLVTSVLLQCDSKGEELLMVQHHENPENEIKPKLSAETFVGVALTGVRQVIWFTSSSHFPFHGSLCMPPVPV